MGLSPQCTKKAIVTLQKMAPDCPLVYATSRQEESYNKMKNCILILDKGTGGSEAVLLKIIRPSDKMINDFENKKKVISNSSQCRDVTHIYCKYGENPELKELWHIGWF